MLVMVNISCVRVMSMSCCWHNICIIYSSSFVGMFEYMSEMSKDTSCRPGVTGMSEMSFMRCREFWML